MPDKSVFLRGNIWYIRWLDPPGPDGKRRRRMKSCKGMTKKQAQIELYRIQANLEPLPKITLFWPGQVQVAIGMYPYLTPRFPEMQLLEPGRVYGYNESIRVAESELSGGLEAIYMEESDSELLIWNKSLSPRDRLQRLKTWEDPAE